MGDHVVLIAEHCNPSIPQCRICHEEEGNDPKKKMESPCACSGTLKFAHRKCIQRWCDEKENTVCEICLQKFQPGYTAPAKTENWALLIRGEIRASEDRELQNPGLIAIVSANQELLECNNRDSSVSTCCRSVVLTFTALLLVHHALILLREEKDQDIFTLLTFFLLRATGILLPLHIMAQAILAIQRQRQENLQDDGFCCYEDDRDAVDVDDDDASDDGSDDHSFGGDYGDIEHLHQPTSVSALFIGSIP